MRMSNQEYNEIISRGLQKVQRMRGGRLQKILDQIEKGCERISQDDLNVALTYSTYLDNLSAVVALLKAGADPNEGGVSLLVAVHSASLPLVITLLEAGAKADANESLALASVSRTSVDNSEGFVRALVHHGARINDREGEALHEAVLSWNHKVTETLVELGADPNAREGLIIQSAVQSGEIKILETLIKAGATQENLEKAMDAALSSQGAESYMAKMIHHLAEAGIRIRPEDKQKAFLKALDGMHLPLMKRVLDMGANPNDKEACAVDRTCIQGEQEMLSLLMQHGADLGTINDESIRHMVRFGNTDMLDFLVGNDIEVDTDLIDETEDAHPASTAWRDARVLRKDIGKKIKTTRVNVLKRESL